MYREEGNKERKERKEQQQWEWENKQNAPAFSKRIAERITGRLSSKVSIPFLKRKKIEKNVFFLCVFHQIDFALLFVSSSSSSGFAQMEWVFITYIYIHFRAVASNPHVHSRLHF